MRLLLTSCLLLLATGCIPFSGGVTPAGNPVAAGVLVQGTQGRCTWVLVGRSTRRVCLPPGAADDPAPADSDAATDSTALVQQP